jgi:hypothetical protein
MDSVFEENLNNHQLMKSTLKSLRAKCKQLKLNTTIPRTKQEACLRIYKFYNVDIRDTDIFAKYEAIQTEHAKSLCVKKIKALTEQLRIGSNERIFTNKRRLAWIDSGFSMSREAINAYLSSELWDANANLTLVEEIEAELRVVGPCESKMIENEHHICQVCCERYNLSDCAMQIISDCGHVFCSKCVSRLDFCPVCRNIKKKVVTLFV